MGASGDPPGCCPAEGERVDASPPSPRGVVFGARASRHLTTLSAWGGVLVQREREGEREGEERGERGEKREEIREKRE